MIFARVAGTVVCTLDTLANGATLAVQLTVRVVARTGTIMDTATVSSATSDPTPSNNTATVATRIG